MTILKSFIIISGTPKMASDHNEIEVFTCKGCNEEWPRKSILRHLKKKDCRNAYTNKEYEALKSSSRRNNMLRNKLRKKETYSKDARSRRHKKEKASTSKKYKEKKEKAKQESTPDQRILDFRHANQHGPIFTCISCHRNLFKKGVKELTSKLESKIRNNGMYRYISNFSSSDISILI